MLKDFKLPKQSPNSFAKIYSLPNTDLHEISLCNRN